MGHEMFQELELWLGYLEEVPYRHSRAVLFLSYVYQHPEVMLKYGKIMNLTFDMIRRHGTETTDEPIIYAYQTAALIARLTQLPLPQWTGIPSGDTNSVVWQILQYYPSLLSGDRYIIKEWAARQLTCHCQWAYDTSIILQYLANIL